MSTATVTGESTWDRLRGYTPPSRFIPVLATLALLYHRWEAARDDDLAAEYVARSGTLGRSVTVLGGDGVRTTGEAIGVDEAGRLRIRTASGVQTFAAGDVTHLR